MLTSADHYRRMARLSEEAAERVSLRSAKEELLADARALRRRAEELAAQSRAGEAPFSEAASTPIMRFSEWSDLAPSVAQQIGRRTL